jgi:VPDSG-CTERM motif
MNKNLLSAIAIAVVSFVTFGAEANTVSGRLWKVSEATSQNAIPANVPGSAPDVTFDVLSPINFFGTSTTVGTWLGNGSAFNIVENTAGALSSLMDPTLIEFTGSVSVVNGQTFTVTHDDGLTLIIGGLNLGFNPGPTAPTTTTATYTGPTGNFAFQLVYGECCGGPAVLQVDLPFTNSVPDGGSTLALLGGALTMLGAVSRRLRK